MWFSKKANCVFLANQKTGTRSVIGYLMDNYGLRLVGRKEHGARIPKRYENRFSFTFVRNPYERTVSLWWTRTRLRPQSRRFGMGLEDWIRDVHASQLKFVNVDRVCRFENFEEEIMSLPFYVPGTVIPHKNPSRRKRRTKAGGLVKPMPPYEQLLTPKIKELIAERYEEDFRVLGYET
jgi:hypothetical protein